MVQKTDNVFVEAEKFSQNNRESLSKSSQCGCYHCEHIFLPNEVKEWDGDTALCPQCQFDAVIGDHDRTVTPIVLKSLRSYWF